jgi:hypothetical protein
VAAPPVAAPSARDAADKSQSFVPEREDKISHEADAFCPMILHQRVALNNLLRHSAFSPSGIFSNSHSRNHQNQTLRVRSRP